MFGFNRNGISLNNMGTSEKISVKIRLFAGLREQAKISVLKVQLSVGTTVNSSLAIIVDSVPGNLMIGPQVMFAVNRSYVDGEKVLRDGDELALIPPVSGGQTIDNELIEITPYDLESDPIIKFVTTDVDGAVVAFFGVTRKYNEGRKVNYLEYEAFEPMALEQVRGLIHEIREKWDVGKVGFAHRTGIVPIGQTSMILAVGSPHRAVAFEAALYFVDKLKTTVPIWKKECFQGGEIWIEGHSEH